MYITWDRAADAAYISLIDPHERTAGIAAESVPLEEIAEDAGLAARHSLVLDFDTDGKLIGIEVLVPRRSLRESKLGAAAPL